MKRIACSFSWGFNALPEKKNDLLYFFTKFRNFVTYETFLRWSVIVISALCKTATTVVMVSRQSELMY